MSWVRDLPVTRLVSKRARHTLGLHTTSEFYKSGNSAYNCSMQSPAANPLNFTSCLRPQFKPCRPPSSEAAAVVPTGLLGATILPTDGR